MRLATACVLACLCCCLGCSSGVELAEVSGTVTLDGEPIEEGSIQFIPIDGTTGPAGGETIRNGKYHISRAKGVAVGKNRVELRAFKSSGKMVADPTGPPGAKTAERVPAFPPEYNEKSTLVENIRAGSNNIDFNIKTKGP